MKQKKTIVVIGLGYVGLPLAIEFSKKYSTVGFDIDQNRIKDLNLFVDKTMEVASEDLKHAEIIFTSNLNEIYGKDIYIVTVPTPIDKMDTPDLSILQSATEIVGRNIQKGGYVIFESTVYPGCTEEVCIPIIERISGLKINKDFYCGYSPERINPGDKANKVNNIVKITSGSNREAAKFVDELYREIVTVGTYCATSIKVAEAAKAIENTQRDVNVALMNELSIVCHKLGIKSADVLDAAQTKWNFMRYKPGLVGGHCIGVDPYYLTYKAKELGYTAEVMLAGRKINDSMGEYIGQALIRLMIKKKIDVSKGRVLILGMAFKENCPDSRNSKVYDIYCALKDYHLEVDVYDPLVDPQLIKQEYKLSLLKKISKQYDAVVMAVSHDIFKCFDTPLIHKYLKKKNVIYDVKGFMSNTFVDESL